MKKIYKYTKLIPLALILLFIQGCVKSRDEYIYIQIGTVKKIEISETEPEKKFYFLLDSNEELYPRVDEGYLSKRLDHNDRVIVQFTEVEQYASKKELHAKIQMIHPIRTVDIEFADKEDISNQLANSNTVNITEAYIANGFLTLKYSYLGGYKPDKDHKFKMLAFHAPLLEPESRVETEDIARLTLIHDAKEDTGTQIQNGIISFPTDNIKSLLEDKEQLNITINTVYDGIKEYSINLKKSR